MALAAAGALAACGGPVGTAGTGAGSLPFDGRSPVAPQEDRVRVLVELRRPSLAEQMREQEFGAGRQRAYVSSLGDEAGALQSALRAKGVQLRKPVLYARVWNGFAATVDTRDLPELRALGLRAEPVRRFYGAGAGGGAQGAESEGAGAGGKPTVALIDSGVESGAEPGFDAVGNDRDPSPSGERERHGTTMARLLAAEGAGVLSIRVAGLQADPQTGGRLEFATTDQLLAGLERAVDPDGDGDTTDHVPVALVGVNSPYAGFAGSPEATAAADARALGTLVVAPAGNEGGGSGPLGTIGSPAAAPGVLAVGGLDGGEGPALPSVRLGLATGEGRALLRGTLLGGGGEAKAFRAPVSALAGPSQADPKADGRAAGGSPLEYFDVDAEPRARGHVVVVPARAGKDAPPLAARAAAAAESGATGLVICEPDPDRSLSALPDGAPGVLVIGLRGAAARRALELTPEDGGLAFVSEPEPRAADGPLRPGSSSSHGPTYALAPKPDLAAPATATLPGGEVVAGSSVAAARVAAAAAKLHAERPDATPDDLASALTGTARPLAAPLTAGAGELQLEQATRSTALIEPFTLALPRQPARAAFTVERKITVANAGDAPLELKLAVELPGLVASVSPAELTVEPGARQTVTLKLEATGSGRPPGYLTGRIRTAAGADPAVASVIGVPIGPPPPARLGPLALSSSKGDTDGVRFTAGALAGGDPAGGGARSVEPLGNLRLQLVDDKGKVVRELTPPGGAADLLPGQYAYTLTKDTRGGLRKGTYKFVARGRGPAGGAEVVRSSPTFRVR